MKKDEMKKLTIEELESRAKKSDMASGFILGFIVVMIISGIAQMSEGKSIPFSLIAAVCFIPIAIILRKSASNMKAEVKSRMAP